MEQIHFDLPKPKKQYWIRLLSGMLAFLLLCIFPFALITANIAKKQIMECVDDANQFSLSQIARIYNKQKEQAAMVCLSLYNKDMIALLMYNSDVSPFEQYSAISTINSMISTDTTLFSAEVYNQKTQKWYSSNSSFDAVTNKTDQFIKTMDQTLKLTPMFRVLSASTGKDISFPVFSYFMYEYGDPRNGSSVLVLNQRADWLVQAIAELQESGTRAYLMDSSGQVYTPDKSELSPKDLEILVECEEKIQKEQNEETGVFTTSKNTAVVSFLKLSNSGELLILMQDYDQVFSVLQSVKTSFLVIVFITLLVGCVVVYLLCRSFYKPIGELIAYMDKFDVDFDFDVDPESDEFKHVRAVLEKSSLDQKRNLAKEKVGTIALRKLLLSDLLNNSSAASWDEYSKVLPTAPFSKQTNWHCTVIILHINISRENPHGFKDSGEKAILFALENVFRELLPATAVLETVKQRNMELTCVVNQMESDLDQQDLLKILTQLQEFFKASLDINVVVACSEAANNKEALHDLYRSAVSYLQYQVVFGDQHILTAQLCENNLANRATSCSSHNKKKFVESMRLKKEESIHKHLTTLAQEVSQMNYEHIATAIVEILTITHGCLSNMVSLRQQEKVGGFDYLYRTVNTQPTVMGKFNALDKYICNVLFSANASLPQSADEKEPEIVHIVVDFVEKNYTDRDLCLQTIADRYNIASRYLSRIFKQQTGMSLGGYILSYRMKKATMLLINTNYSVEKIAADVGIGSENYFYFLFKKQFGCTPKEFKQNATNAKLE